MFKKTILSLITISAFALNTAKPVEIKKPFIFSKESAGNIKLHHERNKFYVEKDDNLIEVSGAFISCPIRNIDTNTLLHMLGIKKLVSVKGMSLVFERIEDIRKVDTNLLKNKPIIGFTEEETEEITKQLENTTSYIEIIQLDENEYALNLKHRLCGGGPVSGFVAYWVTKVFCYGTAAAALTTATVGTCGAAGAVAGGAAAAAGAGAAAAIGSGTAATVAGIGGAMVAGGSAAAAGGAAVATGAVLASGVSTAVAAVETGSTAVGLFFTAIPFLP